MTSKPHNNTSTPYLQSPRPKRIVIANAKGGCGKSTLATNLASIYAKRGMATALLDYDPQGSATYWLKQRSALAPTIMGIEAFNTKGISSTRNWFMRIPRDIQRVIVDTPAGLQGHQLAEIVAQADLIIVPVLPSPIDIHSTSHFIGSILLSRTFRRTNNNLLVIANRVRKNTRSLDKLDLFLNSLKLPRAGDIRDTQIYVHCTQAGGGIVDFPTAKNQSDQRQWNNLANWIDEQLGDKSSLENTVKNAQETQLTVTQVTEKKNPSSKLGEGVYTVT